MSISPGTKLGRYEIRSKIGVGGMGEVYLAQDTKLDRKVALKILPADLAANRSRLNRFVQEAKAASALNHPNIITIHEFDETDSVNFIATEFIDGETLRQRMRNTTMKLGEVLEVATQIASALSTAHAAGIVHRDIKPDNIMLRRDGIAKVLDFGLAKLTERPPPDSVDNEAPTRAAVNTDPGVVMGTVIYMSPEQARGLVLDARTDIFSLGVLIYEMVAGRLPFEGSNVNEIIGSILSEKESQPLARYSRDVPAELERIVSKALRKDQDERYQTIKDLLLDLKNLKQQSEFERRLDQSGLPESKSATDRGEHAQTETVMESTARPTVGERSPASGIGIGLNKTSTVIPLVSLLIVALGVVAYVYFIRARGGAINSVAVLPFANASGNADLDYLSDGMTETLIRSLSQLPNLNVKARSTVFRYKGKDTDAKTIGKELGVPAVLNGRMTQRGEQLTLSLELIDTQTENVIWTDEYDRKLSDLVSLQNEIARDVSSKLKIKLSGADEKNIAKTYTTNPEAYRLYLRGRFYWNKRAEKDFRQAVEYFNQAIAVDPNYALAFAGLADAYALLSTFGFMPSSEAVPKARGAARQALALDETLAEPHTTLAYLTLTHDYDFPAAESEFKRAIELNPNYATAHQWYGELLTHLGRFDESFAEFNRALQIEPLSVVINWDLARSFYQNRRYDESIRQHKLALELDAGFARAHRTLSEVYRVKGDYANAVEERAKFLELIGQPQQAALFRATFAKDGWVGLLRSETKDNWPIKDTNNSWWLAKTYAELGEKQKAFAELDKAYENRLGSLCWLKVEPQLDPLRSDPRYQELLKKVGLLQ